VSAIDLKTARECSMMLLAAKRMALASHDVVPIAYGYSLERYRRFSSGDKKNHGASSAKPI
jgi:hypothetical protein